MAKILLILILAVTNSVFSQSKRILFILSSADTLELNNGEKSRQTGVFLNEFYLAFKSIIDSGYTVDFATPSGYVCSIDPEGTKDKYWDKNLALKKEAENFIATDSRFRHPISLDEAISRKTDYIGLVIPGGQGIMVDLKNDIRIPIILKYFAMEKKPTGLICHAPSLLLTMPKEENPYLGFNVNSVSPVEEFVIEKFIMKGRPKERRIACQLKRLGLRYKGGLPKSNYAVKDRNLVSSQNPFSGKAFNRLFLQALTEYMDQSQGK